MIQKNFFYINININIGKHEKNRKIQSSLKICRQRGEWLKRRHCDRHGLGSKPTRAILLCCWERHFTALSPAWWSWKAVLN